jgi:hypothetical protein
MQISEPEFVGEIVRKAFKAAEAEKPDGRSIDFPETKMPTASPISTGRARRIEKPNKQVKIVPWCRNPFPAESKQSNLIK